MSSSDIEKGSSAEPANNDGAGWTSAERRPRTRARSTLEFDVQGAIHEELRQKAALIELSHDPILVWDIESGIVDWNKGAEILYGFSREEAIGRNNHDLLKIAYQSGRADFLRTLIAEGTWSGEAHHTTKDGAEILVESRQKVIESNGRRLVLESNRDITERRKAEEILQKYRILSEKSRDVIWFLSDDFRFVEVNQAAIDLYGYSREEFLTMRLTDIRHSSTLPDFPEQFLLARAEGIRFETTHIKKDGTAFPVDVSANSADFGGEKLVLAIVRDISDRKRDENALRESEERRKLAQEAGRVGIWDWDAKTNETYWSETMWSMYDEPREGRVLTTITGSLCSIRATVNG